MAGISTLSGFDYRGQQPNFGRDMFTTVAEMVAFSENYLPDVFITQVVENGKTYKYQRSNIEDADLGKWRELEGGSADLSNYYNRTQTDDLLDDKVDKEVGKILTTNDFTDAYKDLVDANKTAIDTLNADETTDGSVKQSVKACLDDSKGYTDAQIELMNKSGAITCDEKPTYADGTITYIKDGETKTTENLNSWFYYTEDEQLKQTRWIANDDGTVDEKTVVSAGGVNFAEYVSKVNDVVSTYTGAETDTSKIPNLASMQALDAKLQGNIDGKVDNVYDVSKAGQVLVVGEDGNVTLKDSSVLGGNAETVTYENTDYPELTNVDKALDKILAKIYYVEPKINSFTMTPSATEYEKGAVVSGLEFAWTVNKDIVSQSLTDCTIELDDRTATYGADLTSTKTFTLTVSDGEKSASANKKISFLPKIYYGSTTEPTDYDSAFVLGLSDSVLASSSKRDYSFNCGIGEYSYIVCPTSMTFNTIWVNGFQAEINKLITIALTNESGYTQSYDILRFANSGLGSFVGTVK